VSRTVLSDEDFERAAKTLECDVATIRAVAEVEANGSAFLPDGRPRILYEAHVFHRLTNGRHSLEKDRNGIALSVPKWDRSLYGSFGAAQHERLEDAANHDWDAAHKSASWGMFQILGSNYGVVGYPSVQSFVEAMHKGASLHLDAFVAFVKNNKLDTALRNHDWETFARRYNGPAFAANKYDTKLEQAWKKWSRMEEKS
jgi:hypothetical protein